ncbi:MAG: peptidoglycan DD-metalloendopeptidase family protein [Parabacteroides sp.]|jgi:murein hydrolase activator|nr:peptidoglycan DD-metalloendopeptidase family protein [Parabacteroides sp.]MBP9578958.1 peptidoglycan DD-metalloendopeptidase family protein [Parabacteroides sp.]
MRYGWIIVFLVSGLVAFGQNSSKVKQLENQRKKALEEIEMTNQLLNETKKTARSSLNRLNLISNQILSRKKVISILNQEIGGIDTQINKMRREVNRLEQELKVKQKNYGKSAKGMYKRRKSQDKLLFILSADNFAQSLRRMRYLREFADWQKRQAAEIVVKQREIEEKRSALEKTRKNKQVLLGSRENENQKLQTEESSQKSEVQQLNKKQRDLQAQLKKKKQQADALNQQIEKQIAIEIARAEEEARIARQKAERERAEKARLAREAREIRKKQAAASGKKIVEEKEEPEPEPEPIRAERVAEVKGGYAMTREEKKLSDNFAGNKGRLPFPVTGRHTIVGTFGEQQHQDLKYVRTNNSGIDIQTSPGADARAVFNGEVTRVFVVPGYNNSVIVRHGNYLTVYSNLSQVYVKAGDRVSTRQSIGKIFTDTEDGNATILSFQLWKEKTKLNPATWLD